jgi:HlyD family secretion protein/macrolide-specific efflux system membrane fusion protein
MKIKRAFVVPVVIILAVAVGFGLYSAFRKKTPPVLSVPLAAAARGPLEERISASGSFQSERFSVVASQTVGIVKEVRVKPGDSIQKGDVIVVVDEREARESLASAEIALEDLDRTLSVDLASLRSSIRKTSLDFEQAERAAKNAETLRTVDGVSEEEYRKALEERDRARDALADATDRLRVAEGLPAGKTPSLDASRDRTIIANYPSYRRALLTVDGARRVLGGCVIRAEQSGTITEVSVSPGDRLLDETKVARIEDPSSVMADVNVDEVDIGKIREGMAAEITSDSMLGKTIPGQVLRIWPIVKSDGNGRVCPVRITLNREGHTFLSGASCMARITSRVRDDALVIPASALIPGGKGDAVWVAVPVDRAVPSDLAGSVDKAASSVKGGSASQKGGGGTSAQAVTASTQEATASGNDATGAKSGKPGKKTGKKAEAPGSTYTCVRREINLGASTVSSVEVVSGLNPGDLVVIDQLPLIRDGLVVRNGENPK